MFWFILLLLIIGTGFYLNSSAREDEKELAPVPEKQSVPEKIEPIAVAQESVGDETPGVSETSLLETRIVEIVADEPGMKQTQLYPQMSDINKKSLQQAVKNLADSGRITRDKSGSSYLLYPKV